MCFFRLFFVLEDYFGVGKKGPAQARNCCHGTVPLTLFRNRLYASCSRGAFTRALVADVEISSHKPWLEGSNDSGALRHMRKTYEFITRRCLFLH